MAFVVPNATDTVSGQKYSVIDQAEPDSLDFEVLGLRLSGVVSGCEVTAQTVPNLTVQVAGGTIMANGVTYSLSPNASYSLPTSPTNNRFDLIVARVSGGSASLTTLVGEDSSTNSTYPQSKSRVISPNSTHFDPDTDVLLAAVYRSGGSAITTARIVDKRTSHLTTTPFRGTGVPDVAVGTTGDLYYQTDSPISSGLYVKRNSEWCELAKVGTDTGQPIGSLMFWPAGSEPDAASWLEANGAAISRTSYAALFGVYGTTYGEGNGTTTFNLPDYRGFYLSGLPAGRQLGTTYGNNANQVTISTGNLPAHSHGASGITVSSASAHAHTMSHGHTGSSVGDGAHSHTGTTVSDGAHQHYYANMGSGGNLAASGSSIGNTNISQTVSSGSHTHSFTTNTAGSHTHSISVSTFTGSTLSDGAHGHSLTGSTDSVGSGTAMSIEPATKHVRIFVRHS